MRVVHKWNYKQLDRSLDVFMHCVVASLAHLVNVGKILKPTKCDLVENYKIGLSPIPNSLC